MAQNFQLVHGFVVGGLHGARAVCLIESFFVQGH
jgi:hypothetical protein